MWDTFELFLWIKNMEKINADMLVTGVLTYSRIAADICFSASIWLYSIKVHYSRVTQVGSIGIYSLIFISWQSFYLQTNIHFPEIKYLTIYNIQSKFWRIPLSAFRHLSESKSPSAYFWIMRHGTFCYLGSYSANNYIFLQFV